MNVRNGKIIWKLSFRTLLAARKRNIIGIMAIAMTALLFTSLFTITLSINDTYQNSQFKAMGGRGHGAFKDVTEEQIELISSHKKIKATGLRVCFGEKYDGEFATSSAEISYMDANCTDWSFATPTTGHMPEAENEISMDTVALRMLGAEPVLGEQITVTYTLMDEYYNSIEEVTDTFTLAGFWDYDPEIVCHYINVSKAYCDKIQEYSVREGYGEFRCDLNVMLHSSFNIEETMEQVQKDLGLEDVAVGVGWAYTASGIGDDVGTIIAIIMFVLLIIFTGYLVIYNIFQISVSGDIRFYGLLKTIGVTPSQLRRIIRNQAIILSAVGIPIGLAAGYGVGALLVPVVMGQSTFEKSDYAVGTSPFIFVFAALFALATVILSVSRPGKMASKVSPIEASKYTDGIRKKKKSIGKAGLLQMAAANLGRNKKRTVITIISLSLSVVLLNFIFSLASGFDIDKYLSYLGDMDFQVSTCTYFSDYGDNGYIPEELVSAIKENTVSSEGGCAYAFYNAYPAVSAYINEDYYNRMIAAEVKMDLKMSPEIEMDYDDYLAEMKSLAEHRGDTVLDRGNLIIAMDDDLLDKVQVFEGSIEPLKNAENNCIAINVDDADYEEGDCEEGDYYPEIGETITVFYGSEEEIDYTVCAYVYIPSDLGLRFYIDGYYFLTGKDILEKNYDEEISPVYYAFNTPDDESKSEAEEFLSLFTADSLYTYETNSAKKASFIKMRQSFLLIGGILCGIIAIIGILNFINAIITGIISRKTEFAVLQAIGMTKKQLKNMLIYEGLFYAVVSSVIALIFSAIFGAVEGPFFDNLLWFYSSKSFNIVPALIAVPVFVLLGWCVPTIVYSQDEKLSIVDRLREV